MRDIAYESEAVTCPDNLGTEFRQPIVPHCARLKVSDVVGRVMHELCVADTAPVRLFQPLELHLEKIQPFDIHDDGRLSSGMGRRKIGSSEGAT
jgi:hypothetical protein